ncbi:hypothetical protein TNCV_1238571 [Trichonephila clavipes]|nr:hypothetical protein TNCV_1238571 [Trichonephila clavipes]
MAKRDGGQHEKKPKSGEERGNKRRQSQPGRDMGGAKHETGRNGQNDITNSRPSGSEISRTADCHTPPTASAAFVEASKPKFNNAPKILSPEIKFKIYQRNRLRKLWQRTRCPSIYSEFRTLSREIAKYQAHSRVQWEKHDEALSPVDNTLWRKSSYYCARNSSEQPRCCRELFDQRIHDEVTNFINTPRVQEIEPTTPTEVLSYVQRLQPRKSPGLDQISNPVRVSTQVLDSSSKLRVTELIHSGFAKHEAPGILFLDIAKAFDKIWHDGSNQAHTT